MTTEQEHPVQSIYVTDDEFESTICGVHFRWREISGVEVIKLMALQNQNDFDSSRYIKQLIKLCLIEPADLNIDKMKTAALGQLMSEIEESLGLSQVMQKNWKTRSK